MRMKLISIFACAVLTCTVAGTIYWVNFGWIDFDNSPLSRSVNTPREEMAASRNKTSPHSSSSVTTEPIDSPSSQSVRLFIQKLAAEVVEKYGATIQNKQTQVKLMEVRDYVMELFPLNGETIFTEILYTAFPEYAAEILNTLNLLSLYERWLEDHYPALSKMAFLEREGTIWKKRHEFFGSDADEIWKEEKYTRIQKQQELQEVFTLLDKSDDLSLNETLFQLQEAVNAAYDNGIEKLTLNNGVIESVYFGFESVQKKLREIPPEQRQEQINQLRIQLGYTDVQVQQLARRDSKRNKRWENGLNYMAQRNALTAELSGAELERELNALREQYFKHEAKTIALEEQDGFFRYLRPRLYGRN